VGASAGLGWVQCQKEALSKSSEFQSLWPVWHHKGPHWTLSPSFSWWGKECPEGRGLILGAWVVSTVTNTKFLGLVISNSLFEPTPPDSWVDFPAPLETTRGKDYTSFSWFVCFFHIFPKYVTGDLEKWAGTFNTYFYFIYI
jgi:hypothetical protein